MFKRLLLLILLIAVLFGGVFGWKFWQIRQMGASQQMPPPAVVASSTVQRDSWQPRMRAIGTLSASQGIRVTSEVAGKVAEIHFQSGQRVDAGAPLIALEDSTDQAELRARIAERDLAQLKYKRLSTLVNDRSASRSEFDEAKGQLDISEAQVALQRALIAKKRINAPFAGTLGLRQVDLGEYLAPGTAIVSLTALDPIYLDFSLPEREFQRLQPGGKVAVRVAAHPDRVFEGSISALDPEVNVGTRTLPVRATLANPDGLLRPGMFAETEILMDQQQPVLTLPRAAITYAPYGDSVFVIEQGDQGPSVQRRAVTTGAVLGERVVIDSGLQDGDQVVLAGQVKLRNGQQVQIDNQLLPQGAEIGK